MKHLVLIISLFVGLHYFAQEVKKIDPATKYFYKDATLETDDYKIYIVDVIAVGKQLKFKIKIFNKTNDYLFIKPNEISYVTAAKTVFSKDENYVVPPNEEEREVIDFRGTEMQVDNFTLDIKGIYKASAGGQIIRMPNFNLPPTKNEFTIGNFTCTLKKTESKTDKAYAKFECQYAGDYIGIINPNKCIAIMPNGTDNPNVKKQRALILEKNKSDDFLAVFLEVKDAGDLKKNSIAINWNETFRESKLIKLPSSKLEMVKESEKK